MLEEATLEAFDSGTVIEKAEDSMVFQRKGIS